MATVITINAGDQITNSRADINTSLANLNADKVETSAIDTDTTLAANSDAKIPSQKAVKAYVDAGGNVNASTTVKGIVEEATDAEAISRTAVGATGARLFLSPASLSKVLKFGGTGDDGALSITSGTTTIDLAGARYIVKNYSSITISGTGQLAFSNPHTNGTIIILKCVGNVSITSSANPAIDLRSLGSAAGTGGAPGEGTDGSTGVGTLNSSAPGAKGRQGSGSNFSGSGGAFFNTLLDTDVYILSLLAKAINITVGAGGGGGASNNGTTRGFGGGGGMGAGAAGQTQNATINAANSGSGNGGNGGRGAGSLVLEVGGSYTCSGTINASGAAGSNSSSPSNGGGGGGGGGGGMILVLANTIASDTGTYTVTGGAGGDGLNDNDGGAGGAGYSLRLTNVNF